MKETTEVFEILLMTYKHIFIDILAFVVEKLGHFTDKILKM